MIIDFLDRAAKAYYDGSPIITDAQFDRLADSTGYSSVGARQHANVEKHYSRMYSLQKYYADSNKQPPLQEFKNKAMTPKLDGAAVSLLYVGGKLVRALTRGNGIEGRVVTDKFLAHKLVPLGLANTFDDTDILQVTGELCAPKHIENARNYAAGALNLGSVDEFRTRAVEFFAYAAFPHIGTTFDEEMLALKLNGFNTVQDKGIDQIYPTDGVVFRINNHKEFEALGYTSKHPNGAYALKENQECVETELLAVEWQVGKTGKVTPVAILEPVMVGDAVVSRATLNNQGFLLALDLSIGDTVLVRRSGEVIPQIVGKAAM